MQKKVTAVLIGAGDRGMNAYSPYALCHPDELSFVGVVNRSEQRRKKYCKIHGIDEAHCFENWDDFFSKDKMADAVLICTPDKMHYEPALKALEKGYHVLLEKPLSTNPARCQDLAKIASQTDLTFMLCYVLRYTPFYQKIKSIIDSGKIGDLVSIQQNENIGYEHFAHSFVRGNWANSQETCSLILAKTCHDLDIFYWLAKSKCETIQSFGKLTHFTEENAPMGAPDFCMDGCPQRNECIYYAPAMYTRENSGFSSAVVSDDDSIEGRMKALHKGAYGRCVYKCGNDACDNQVVNIEFKNGVTVSFSINAFSYECNRSLRVYGTKGELRGDLVSNRIEFHDFVSGTCEIYNINSQEGRHGGGDYGIMQDFVNMINGSGKGKGLTSIVDAEQSHIMAFAAEKSRLENCLVNIDAYRDDLLENSRTDIE